MKYLQWDELTFQTTISETRAESLRPGVSSAAGLRPELGDLIFRGKNILEHRRDLGLGALLGEIVGGLRLGRDFLVDGVEAFLVGDLLLDEARLVELDRVALLARLDFLLRAIVARVGHRVAEVAI